MQNALGQNIFSLISFCVNLIYFTDTNQDFFLNCKNRFWISSFFKNMYIYFIYFLNKINLDLFLFIDYFLRGRIN